MKKNIMYILLIITIVINAASCGLKEIIEPTETIDPNKTQVRVAI